MILNSFLIVLLYDRIIFALYNHVTELFYIVSYDLNWFFIGFSCDWIAYFYSISSC